MGGKSFTLAFHGGDDSQEARNWGFRDDCGTSKGSDQGRHALLRG